MTLLYSLPLASTFTGVSALQANGIMDIGDNLPNGIGDSLCIEEKCMVARLRETDAVAASGHRCEIIPGPLDALNDERWYTWEWMALNWPTADTCSGDKCFSVMQIHDKTAGARSPNFELWYNGIGLIASTPLYQPPIEDVRYRGIGAIQITQGVWNTLALHAIWSNTGAGTLDFYVNRKLVFKQINIGTAYNADTPYLKLGVYNYQGLTGFNERTSRVKNIKVYSGDDGYATVLGGSPICIPFSDK